MSLTHDDIGVWLINLRRNTERRARMDEQLRRLGLDYILFPAIDGGSKEEQLGIRVDAKAYSRNMGVPLLPGKMGVYASHVAVWEALHASTYRAGLILEDDVIFHDDFVQALDTALTAASSWDLVRFCCVRAKLPVTQGHFGRYRLNAYVGPFTGNAAYLIHSDVAARLLPGLWPQTRAFDHELNRFDVHEYRLRGLEPFSCRPDDRGVSTITGENFSLVNKPEWYKRIPYYRLKAGNYWRRGYWLLRQGSILGSIKDVYQC